MNFFVIFLDKKKNIAKKKHKAQTIDKSRITKKQILKKNRIENGTKELNKMIHTETTL